ncbi:hypothetical protein GYH30_040133 [Glycine max]|nr:hypothetical protein GYH30_040133 [Glycine max]
MFASLSSIIFVCLVSFLHRFSPLLSSHHALQKESDTSFISSRCWFIVHATSLFQ